MYEVMLHRLIPIVAAEFPYVHFIVGGDGPKKLLLEEMRERYLLHDRVELLGSVPHHAVRDVCGCSIAPKILIFTGSCQRSYISQLLTD